MATLTLTRMAEGGIYDQLGGGFARYSVDPYWMIPHFEKMLYDNGALLGFLFGSGARHRRSLFRRIANETGDWLLREMQDASSDGRAAASTRPTTRTPKATKASSTCGRRRKRARR